MKNNSNPVFDKDNVWADTDLKCNYCGGDCRMAQTHMAPNGSKSILVNCLNEEHLNKEYGFYIQES